MNLKQATTIMILLVTLLILSACAGQSATLARTAAPVQPTVAEATQSVEPTATQPAKPAIPPGDLTRTNEGGSVTFEVKPLNLGDAQAPTVDFEVAMDTHSVDLAFDLSRLSLLKTDTGVEAAVSVWSGSGGGHHVSGILSFTADKVTNARSLTLIIKDVSGVPERTFNWELP